MTADSKTPHVWPLFDLRITTPRLQLRLPTDDELVRQLAAVEDGVHPVMVPFHTDWVNRPSPEREREFLKHHWSQRASWLTSDWNLLLACFVDGAPIGSQSIAGQNFSNLGRVNTGSWLSNPHQGKGLGTEMRAAVLELAFVGLNATLATSGARLENGASLGVSRKLGYENNGQIPVMMGDQRTTEQLLALTRERWAAHRPDIDIEIHGLDACLDMFSE